jgi:hypothetical protein
MARNDNPAASPREISSRSFKDSRSSELPGGRGRRPALATMNVRIEPCARPIFRAIPRIASPRSSTSQISAFSASENRLVITHLQSNQHELINEALR